MENKNYSANGRNVQCAIHDQDVIKFNYNRPLRLIPNGRQRGVVLSAEDNILWRKVSLHADWMAKLYRELDFLEITHLSVK